MKEFEPAQFAEMVGLIYESAVDSKLWDELLTSIERFYPESRIALFGHQDGRPGATLAVHKNYPAADLQAYVDYFATNSPHVARASLLPIGKAALSEILIEDREFEKTEHYNDFVRPRRLGYHAAGMVLERSPGQMTALSIANKTIDSVRRDRQIRLLDMLAPHLQRALQLRRKLVCERQNGEAAQAVFDRWAHAAFVLDATGRLVSYNAAARALLQREDGIALGRGGKLLAADARVAQDIEVAAQICAATAGSPLDRAIAAKLDAILLPRPSGKRPLRAMIWPLPFLRNSEASRSGGATLLVILDPDRAPRTLPDWLGRQYRLSPSEQRLTELLVNGAALAEAAEQLGIRLSTARTRLKTVQAKTQCHRQSDLVRLAWSLPDIRPDEP